MGEYFFGADCLALEGEHQGLVVAEEASLVLTAEDEAANVVDEEWEAGEEDSETVSDPDLYVVGQVGEFQCHGWVCCGYTPSLGETTLTALVLFFS